MRRKDRQILELSAIKEIVARQKICRLAFFDEDYPYIVPMNFGCEWHDASLTLYFHGANTGRKIDLLKTNAHVCFEMDGSHELTGGEIACDYSYNFESVIGNGEAQLIEDLTAKKHALLKIMEQQTGSTDFSFSDQHLKQVAVFSVVSKDYAVKRHE